MDGVKRQPRFAAKPHGEPEQEPAHGRGLGPSPRELDCLDWLGMAPGCRSSQPPPDTGQLRPAPQGYRVLIGCCKTPPIAEVPLALTALGRALLGIVRKTAPGPWPSTPDMVHWSRLGAPRGHFAGSCPTVRFRTSVIGCSLDPVLPGLHAGAMPGDVCSPWR